MQIIIRLQTITIILIKYLDEKSVEKHARNDLNHCKISIYIYEIHTTI